MDRIVHLFSIDIRALAAVRVGIAVIVLQDVVRRALDAAVFYGDAGVLPSSYTQEFWTGEWAWSLHLAGGGDTWWVLALLSVQALIALALLVGFKTRLATILTWVLVVSLHNANQLILQGEDVLLRVVLLVSIFLPLGAAYSVDRARGARVDSDVVFNGWTVAYLLQMGFLYFFVSIYKHSPEWVGGTAAYYALSLDQYATHIGRYLLQFDSVLSTFTVIIFFFQTFALFLLFSPFYTSLIRGLTVAGLITMHASFAISMHLGMFSAVSIVALLAFLPGPFWDQVDRLCRVLPQRARAVFTRTGAVGERSPSDYLPSRLAWLSLLGAVYAVYIFLWHIGNVFVPGQYVPFTHGFEIPAKVLRMDQRWNLFAPYPYKHDGWIVIPATRVDGSVIDLFAEGAPVSFDRPEVIYDTYPRPRWRRYFLSLWQDYNARFREPYAQYLCRVWNADASASERIETLDVIYMVEWTQPPGAQPIPIERRTLIAWDCRSDSRR